jgi:hypothetical protein
MNRYSEAASGCNNFEDDPEQFDDRQETAHRRTA